MRFIYFDIFLVSEAFLSECIFLLEVSISQSKVRYIIHLFCLDVQAGFYSYVVEILPLD